MSNRCRLLSYGEDLFRNNIPLSKFHNTVYFELWAKSFGITTFGYWSKR